MRVRIVSGAAMRRRNQRRSAPARVEIFDAAGNFLGAVLMARSDRLFGPGAETVYLRRDTQPERLRQTA